jgi:hypothetical protein
MTDVSIVGAVLAGLVSFLSPCVLPLVPGYASMLSGIGMEQLRQGQPPRVGLFATSFAFVAGFSFVFISFGASASAVGQLACTCLAVGEVEFTRRHHPWCVARYTWFCLGARSTAGTGARSGGYGLARTRC